MKSLLWKEFREKWFWLALLMAAVLIPIIAGDGYVFSGSIASAGWSAQLALVVSILFGLSVFSGDLSRGTFGFLLSRHVSWKKALAAKLIIGLSFIVITNLLGVVIFRILLPVEYSAQGATIGIPECIGWSFLVTCIPYLVGAACSTVLPGIMGSAVVFVSVLFAFILHGSILNGIDAVTEIWTSIAWAIGTVTAGLYIVRFGITSSIKFRIVRFYLVFIVVGLVGSTTLIFCLRAANVTDSDSWTSISICHDGRLAARDTFYRQPNNPYQRRRLTLINMRDGKPYRICDYQVRTSDSSPVIWTSVGEMCYLDVSNLHIAGIDSAGQVDKTEIQLNPFTFASLIPSSDSRLVIVEERSNIRSSLSNLEVVDLEKHVKIPITITGIRYCWWQSNNEIGFVDGRSKRHIVKVRTDETIL